MSDESKTENDEAGTEPVETEEKVETETDTGTEPEESASNSSPPASEASSEVTSSEDLARLLGVEAEEDPDLDESIRAVSQDVTDDVNTMEQELARRKSNKTATIIFLTCFFLLIGFVATMWVQHGDQFAAFFGGTIEEHKLKDRRDQEKRWREIENLQTNNYGSTELIYSPGDAVVTMKMLKYVENEKDFISRMKHNVDKRTTPKVTCTIDNRSMHLKENEKIKKLSFPTLPIQERLSNPAENDKFIASCVCTNDVQCGEGTKCQKARPEHETKRCVPIPMKASDDEEKPKKKDIPDELSMATYRYEVEIAKEGYEARKFLFAGEAVGGLPTNVELLTWEKIGPAVFIINFSGADLAMDPETAKELVRKAMVDMKCELPKVKDEGEKYVLQQQIQIRHKFQTMEEWDKITAKLKQEHSDWWVALEKELPKFKCP